jgi:Tfp pilus assembly PilM family ATPase/Tfp pilus assembly protein PilN
MLLFQSSLGVEIGDDSLALVYLKGSFKGIILAGHSFHPIEKNLPLGDKLAIASDIVGDFIEKNRISVTSIFLGIPRHSVVLRFIELPLAVKENLRESLGYEMEKYAPIPVDRAYFDCQIVEEDSAANKMRVLLVLAKRESLTPYFELRNRWDMGISGVEISSTGIANYLSCVSKTADGAPYLLLDVRGNSLELNVIKAKLLFSSRSVSVPENSKDLDSFILRELTSLKGEQAQNAAMRVVALWEPKGATDSLKRLEEAMNVEVLAPEVLGPGLEPAALMDAYGLALKGIQKVPLDINLMPADLRKKPSRLSYYTMLMLAAMLIISFASWGVSSILRERLHLKRLNSEIARLSVEIKEVENLHKRCEDLQTEIDYLNRVRGNSTNFLNILKDLTERIPKNAWVSALTYSEQGVQIGGYAESASKLIPLLEASPLLRDAVFLSTITKTKDGKERFEIGLKIR